jgi:hypothetical protein
MPDLYGRSLQNHACVALTRTVLTLPQSAAAMPFGPTTILLPLSAKSVVSPDIDQVMGLPSPPVTLNAETTIPGAVPQASVEADGVNTIASGAWTVTDNVAVALPAKAGEAAAVSAPKIGINIPNNFMNQPA